MAELLWQSRVWLQYSACALLFLLSLRRGAMPERILSSLFVAMPVADALYHLASHGALYFGTINVGHFVIDALAFVIAFAVALYANRIYPLWIAGVQLIALLSHFYKLVLGDFDLLAYQIMQTIPSYLQIAVLACGVMAHILRHRKTGNYPSWRTSFAPMRDREPQRFQGA